MCKTAYKYLLHCVVDLCCGLGSMGLLIWQTAGPDDPGKYSNALQIDLLVFIKCRKKLKMKLSIADYIQISYLQNRYLQNG